MAGSRGMGVPPWRRPQPRCDPRSRAPRILKGTSPPPHPDHPSLNPEVQAILDSFPEDGPAAHEVPIDQARAAHITETAVLAGGGGPVGAAHHEGVPGGPPRHHPPA